jgi:hypothetical protein
MKKKSPTRINGMQIKIPNGIKAKLMVADES